MITDDNRWFWVKSTYHWLIFYWAVPLKISKFQVAAAPLPPWLFLDPRSDLAWSLGFQKYGQKFGWLDMTWPYFTRPNNPNICLTQKPSKTLKKTLTFPERNPDLPLMKSLGSSFRCFRLLKRQHQRQSLMLCPAPSSSIPLSFSRAPEYSTSDMGFKKWV